VIFHPLPALADNYIWYTLTQSHLTVVDPGQPHQVNNIIIEHQVKSVDIIITHYHPDHTNGINGIQNAFSRARVFAPKPLPHQRITWNHHNEVSHNQPIASHTQTQPLTAIYTPGHTINHVCYYNDYSAFCGDTLFKGGCGRIIDSKAIHLFHSLALLCERINDSTPLYPAHEYTLQNLAFAALVEPNNQDIITEYNKCLSQREKGICTLPTNMALEKRINPFIRALLKIGQFDPQQITPSADSLNTFTQLREKKDAY